MKSSFIFLLIAGALLFNGCAGKKELVTYWKSDLKADVPKFSGYDFESKLRWTTSNDTEYLYFDIGCLDPDMQQSLIRGGLTVFLDTTVRKREYVFFKFPNVQVGRAQGNARQRGSRQQSSNLFDRGITPEMIEVINMSPVYWQSGEVWSLEDPMSDSTDFKSGVTMDSTKTLVLHVAVPLKTLHPHGLAGLDKLSIGFSMQGMMRTSGMGGAGSGGQQMMTGGSSGGGRGGGGRGGGGGSRGGGGGSRGGSSGGGMPAQGMGGGGAPIAFWYVTSLSKR